jgi:hypothetical protein
MHSGNPSQPHSLDEKGIRQFWSKVHRGVNPAGCWCVGRQNTFNYGGFNYGGRTYAVHRLAYELTYGFPPTDRVLMHLCQNKWCCNPDHLQVGTSSENAQDMWDVRLGRKKALGQ